MNPIVLIPARMAATRFPGKPLKEIGGLPMVVQVVRRALAAGVAKEVCVAAGDEEIVQAVEKHGHRAILTVPELPSGTDRVYAALCALDPEEAYDVIINVQGDEPAIAPETIRKVYEALVATGADMATAVTSFREEADRQDPNKVKALVHWRNPEKTQGMAENFSRAVPEGGGKCYQHIGIYAYTRKALAKLVALPQSEREKSERLEQLRALDNGMKIAAAYVEKASRGVDTEDDLKAVRRDILESNI